MKYSSRSGCHLVLVSSALTWSTAGIHIILTVCRPPLVMIKALQHTAQMQFEENLPTKASIAFSGQMQRFRNRAQFKNVHLQLYDAWAAAAPHNMFKAKVKGLDGYSSILRRPCWR